MERDIVKFQACLPTVALCEGGTPLVPGDINQMSNLVKFHENISDPYVQASQGSESQTAMISSLMSFLRFKRPFF